MINDLEQYDVEIFLIAVYATVIAGLVYPFGITGALSFATWLIMRRRRQLKELTA